MRLTNNRRPNETKIPERDPNHPADVNKPFTSFPSVFPEQTPSSFRSKSEKISSGLPEQVSRAGNQVRYPGHCAKPVAYKCPLGPPTSSFLLHLRRSSVREPKPDQVRRACFPSVPPERVPRPGKFLLSFILLLSELQNVVPSCLS
ncbi:hypothetical protein Dimus_038400 [Dionaea muscipula]